MEFAQTGNLLLVRHQQFLVNKVCKNEIIDSVDQCRLADWVRIKILAMATLTTLLFQPIRFKNVFLDS